MKNHDNLKNLIGALMVASLLVREFLRLFVNDSNRDVLNLIGFVLLGLFAVFVAIFCLLHIKNNNRKQ